MARIVTTGENRGKRRLWLEGAWLAAAGFTYHAPYTAHFEEGRIVLALLKDISEETNLRVRRVSGKKKGDGYSPIIDINTDDLPIVGKVSVIITANTLTLEPVR